MSQVPAVLYTEAAVSCAAASAQWGADVLRAPFDSLRWAHAAAVGAGLIGRSLRESAYFEQALAVLEQAALGPLARRV